jgi:hypothetical protein
MYVDEHALAYVFGGRGDREEKRRECGFSRLLG